MELVFSLLQQLSVYLVIAYLLSKTLLFMPLITVSGQFSQRIACYVVFSLFCILGTYFGLSVTMLSLIPVPLVLCWGDY